ILDWLTTFDYQSRHNELSRVHAPNTGSWFLKSDAFNSWMGHPNPGSKARPSNVLWCNGVPGSGKSVMMATAIKHITESNRDPTTGVAYFYYDYKTKASSRDIISCLLKQLCTHQPKVPRAVQQLYDRYKEDEMSGSMETLKVKPGPETGELFAALFDVASEFKRTLLCIDGLDECAPEFQEGMLEVIRRLMKVPKCRLLVTSRAEETYQELFRGKLSIQIEAASEDVHAYVRFVLTTHPELRDLVDEHLEIRIAECLSERANGLFLFVYLSMQGLFEQTSVSELKNALEEMPATLDDVYNGILQRIRDQSSSKSRLAMRIFMWLSYCEQPLTIFELQHAIAVDPVLDADDIDPDRIPPARFFEDVCMDLVSIDKDRHLVLLAHASLSQYLTSLRHSLFPRGLKNLAYSILTYLHYTEFASGPCKDSAALRKRLERYPLAMYAARYWGDHVIDYWQGRVPKGIMEFLDSPLKTAAFVQIMYASSSQDFGPMREYPKNVSGLHLAAYFGIQRAVRLILQGDDDTQCAQLIDSWGRTPLHSAMAANLGFEEIVKILYVRGTNLDSRDPESDMTALHYASKAGRTSMVKLLLVNGSNVTLRDPKGRTALFFAAERGDEATLRVLTEYGAEIEARNIEGKTALFECAQKGNVAGEVAQLLIQSGVEVDLQDEDPEHRTALTYAVEAGKVQVAEFLISQHARVDARSARGRTPLFWAIRGGNVEAVRLLLDHGAEVNCIDNSHTSPLVYAVQKGHAPVVKLLLERGA
ncbi:ankyrin, partial [Pleomassaria siparia CBS 279.74]